MQEKIAKLEDSVTEENFEKLQEKHEKMSQLREAVEQAKETGDWSEVEALKEELDLGEGKGFGRRKCFRRGFKQGFKLGCGCNQANQANQAE